MEFLMIELRTREEKGETRGEIGRDERVRVDGCGARSELGRGALMDKG